MKICLAGTGAMGVIHMKALAEDRRASRWCRSPAAPKRAARRSPTEWKIPFSLDESRGVHRSPRRRRRDPDDAERAARGPDAARAVEGQARAGRDPDGLNLPDSERMVAAAKQAGKVLHGHAHAPLLVAASRDQAADPAKARSICITWWSRPISSAATNLNMHGQPRSWVDNLLWHHGCHSVDIAQWLLDDPDLERLGPEGPGSPDARHPDGPDRRHEIEAGAALHAWRCRSTTRGRSAASTATSAKRTPTRSIAIR